MPSSCESCFVIDKHWCDIMTCRCGSLWQDRKVIIKTMKTFVVKIAKEEFGHMVLLAAFDVIDDTKFVQKVILDVRPALSSMIIYF